MPTGKTAGPIVVAIAACLLCVGSANAKRPDTTGGGGDGRDTLEYAIHQLDSAGGAFSSFAADLDDMGKVVGSAVDNATGVSFAACWEVTVASDGSVTSNLDLLPDSSNAYATGVNNRGEVVGDDLGGPGLYWPSTSDGPLLLLPLNGDAESYTTGINEAGVICGRSIGSETHPVVWHVATDGNGQPIVSGPFHLPSVEGHAWDLSELDEDGTLTVTGEAWDGESSAAVAWRVRLHSNGGITTDPQPTILQVGAHARGVNNSGVSCGDSGRPEWTGMLWTQTGPLALEIPRKYSSSLANDVNDSGVVIGGVSSSDIGFPYSAAVWAGPRAKPVLLSSFLSRGSPFIGLTATSAINHAGVIVGAGWDGDDLVEQACIALPR